MSDVWGSRRLLSGIWLCYFLFHFASFPLLLCLYTYGFYPLFMCRVRVSFVSFVNLAFLTLETSHPFGLVHFLPFVYCLWNMPGSFFFRFHCLLSVWHMLLTSAFLYTNKPCCFSLLFNNQRPPVLCLHQALALCSVQFKTWHRAQMRYEGEPVNYIILDDGKICMLSSKKRRNECKKNKDLKCRLG